MSGIVFLLDFLYNIHIAIKQKMIGEGNFMKRWLSKETVFKVLISCLVLVLAVFFVSRIQNDAEYARLNKEASIRLSQLAEQYKKNKKKAKDYMHIYNNSVQSKADAIALLLRYDSSFVQADVFAWGNLANTYGLDIIVLTDGEGNIVATNHYELSDDFCGDFVFKKLISGLSGIDYVKPDGSRQRYFCSRRADNSGYVIVGQSSKEHLSHSFETVSLKDLLTGPTTDQSSYTFAISKDTGKILYHPDERLIGRPASSIGIAPEDQRSGAQAIANINGRNYLCLLQDGDLVTLFASCTDQSDILSVQRQELFTTCIMLCAAYIIVVLYANIIKDEYLHGASSPSIVQVGKIYCNMSLLFRLVPMAILCVCILFAASFCIQSLSILSKEAVVMDDCFDEITEHIQKNEKQADDMAKAYDTSLTLHARAIAFMIDQAPLMNNDATLSKFSKLMHLDSIYIFDENGRVESTNTRYKDFVLSTNEEDQSYEFRSIIRGYTDVVIQNTSTDDLGQSSMKYVGVKRDDAPGVIEVAVNARLLAENIDHDFIDSAYSSIRIGADGFAFTVSKAEPYTIMNYPKDEWMVGTSVSEAGIDPSVIRSGYEGMQRIDHVNYYIRVKEMENHYSVVAVEKNELYSDRVMIALWTTLAGIICMICVIPLCVFSKENLATAKKEPSSSPVDKNGFFSSLDREYWRHKSTEQKLSFVLNVLMFVLALSIIIFEIRDNRLGHSSVIQYILSGKWDRGFNVFALTASLMLFAVVRVISILCGRIIVTLSVSLGSRSETVGRLLASVIRYASILVVLYISLSYLGVNPQTLIASAGILTAVLGLGAQKLIGDILAGCFIVFEGSFHVGDIITIGDWVGTVTEIGIRTTKVKSSIGNIQVFNNSDIARVINMTNDRSYVICDVGIEYGESLERVELVLKEELPLIKKRLRAVKDGPFYKGVSELAESSVNIRIIAQCEEQDRFQLSRDLNREIKLIFDKHHINIPFPQIVINRPETYSEVNEAQKREADRFAKSQAKMASDAEWHDD